MHWLKYGYGASLADGSDHCRVIMNDNKPPTKTENPNDLYDISIVVPVFNEQENLNTLFQELISVLEPLFKTFEIIFVDDGSTDRSFQVLQQLHAFD